MYARDASINSGALSQTEMSMYGSSRLGVWNINRSVANIDTVNYYNFSNHFARGNKLFELSNHLGNVLVTISDKKIGVDEAYTLSCATCPLVLTGTTNGIIDYYKPDVMTANDYYPFGMAMPGRKYSAGSGYRYGFNGKENDNEVKGDGNQQDYGMRIYDARSGRFLSIDPLYKKFPENSQYQFAKNSPILFIDFMGLEPVKDGTTNLTKVSAALKKADVKDLDDLRSHYGSGYFGNDNGKGDTKKYLYSKKWGWIDMRHVSYSAAKIKSIFSIRSGVLSDGELLEYRQELGAIPNHNPTDFDLPSVSAWDYEDLVSNIIGAGFESYLETDGKGKTIVEALTSYLTDLGFNEEPENAPNYLSMPKNYTEDGKNEATEVRSYGYDPKYAPNKNKRNSKQDLNVLKIQKEQENGQPDRRQAIIDEVEKSYPQTGTDVPNRPEIIN
jgi:RHS repeat-associated protein